MDLTDTQRLYFSLAHDKKKGYWVPVVRYLHFYGLEWLARTVKFEPGSTMLVLGGGQGFEAEFFRERGLHAVNCDYVQTALVRGKEAYPKLIMLSSDSRMLPMRDKTVDYCFTRCSLHHIPNPFLAIQEMARVSRKGFGFQEGYDSLLMRMLSSLGITTESEEAGNYIYRFSKREIKKVMLSLKIPGESHFLIWMASHRFMPRNLHLAKMMLRAINLANLNIGNNLLFWFERSTT